METKDHLYLAKLITSTVDIGSKIKKAAFEYGCIHPDINPISYIKGHTYAGTGSYVKNVLTSLYGNLKTPSDYFELGQAIHYIGDYFTFPHTPFFKGTLSEHRNYEHFLHEHISSLKNNLIEKESIDIESSGKCIKLLEKVQKKYYIAKKSVSSDWNNIRYICTNIALSALNPKVKTMKLNLADNSI